MNTKIRKIISILVLSLIVIISLMLFISIIFKSNKDDIFGSTMDAIIALCVVFPVFLVLLELFYNIMYFTRRKEDKNMCKTILNIFSAVLALGILLVMFDIHFSLTSTMLKTQEVAFIIFLLFYFIVRIIYLIRKNVQK